VSANRAQAICPEKKRDPLAVMHDGTYRERRDNRPRSATMLHPLLFKNKLPHLWKIKCFSPPLFPGDYPSNVDQFILIYATTGYYAF
jgi:hypothetical protein